MPTVSSTSRNSVSLDSDVDSPNESNGRNGKVIAIDDDPMARLLLKNHLEKAGFDVATAENGTAGLQLIDETVGVALVDLSLPDITGFEVLEAIRTANPNVSVIILTSSNNEDDAVKAIREGAFQFITKPFEKKQLLANVENAMEHWAVTGEHRRLKEGNNLNITGKMPATGDTSIRPKSQIDRISKLDNTVFISGDSGTGKSTAARMIHQNSHRATGPFVTVNCTSIPRDLIQSELFGHTKGAFTGAVSNRMGHAEVAHTGTLFLDEIGDLPLDLQPKLLTFLQERTVQRMGSTNVRKVDVRLITATQRNLASMCQEGLFRQDLYYRLRVLSIEMPPLRRRMDELENLIQVILKRICERQQIAMPQISSGAMKILQAHQWPGNIRELENVLERATSFSNSHTITSQNLIFGNPMLNRNQQQKSSSPQQANTAANRIPEPKPSPVPNPTSAATTISSTQTAYSLVGKTLDQIERDAIIQTLQAVNGNKAKAARTLGICEKTIYNKMKRLNIFQPKKSRNNPE